MTNPTFYLLGKVILLHHIQFCIDKYIILYLESTFNMYHIIDKISLDKY